MARSLPGGYICLPASGYGVSERASIHDAAEVHVLTSSAEQVAANAAPRCHIAHCTAVVTHTPVLCIALLGSDHVSRVMLPTHICSDHRGAFADRFLTPARRAKMEASLLSHGRDAPDWARTHVEFVLSQSMTAVEGSL